MLVVATSATKSYLYAFEACVRAISVAASHHTEAHFIFTTDTSKESKLAEEALKNLLPEGWQIHTLRKKEEDDKKSYNQSSQLRIAALQGAALHHAKVKLRADLFWSVESDTIVPPNALRVLEWALQFPDASGDPLYHIAAGTYQNGLFLGGFGSYDHVIAEDFLVKERRCPKRFLKIYEECGLRVNGKFIPDKEGKWIPAPETTKDLDLVYIHKKMEKEMRRMHRLEQRAKHYPQDGNIWDIIAKYGWRRRGWLDYAYPGIGEGALVPLDWCGLGCTLIGKRALAISDFSDYQGAGTQDLFLCWNRWHPAGLRIAGLPHILCDHIKRDGDKFIQHHAYHELHGECRGHIRSQTKPWIFV